MPIYDYSLAQIFKQHFSTLFYFKRSRVFLFFNFIFPLFFAFCFLMVRCGGCGLLLSSHIVRRELRTWKYTINTTHIRNVTQLIKIFFSFPPFLYYSWPCASVASRCERSPDGQGFKDRISPYDGDIAAHFIAPSLVVQVSTNNVFLFWAILSPPGSVPFYGWAVYECKKLKYYFYVQVSHSPSGVRSISSDLIAYLMLRVEVFKQ